MSTIKLVLGIIIFIGCVAIIITLSLVLLPNRDGGNDTNATSNSNYMSVGDETNNCAHLPLFGSPSTYFNAYDDYIEIYWNFTSAVRQCKTKYRAILTTDTNTYRLIPAETTINLTRQFFCFTVTLTIKTEDSNDTRASSIRYGMPPVNDIVASEDNGTLIAKWTSNPLEEQCNIIYEVTFKSENRLKKYKVHQPTATTEYLYCTNTTVNVIAVYGDIKGEDSNITIPERYPSSLPPINNITITRTPLLTSAVISWKPPTSVETCINLYTVSARNEKTAEEATCQGTRNCELKLSSFCPVTQFRIRPTSPIEGEETTKRFVCGEDDPI